MKNSFLSSISWFEAGIVTILLLLLAVDLSHTSEAIFAGDDGKYLSWVWHRIETGLYAPFATQTSHKANMILGGASSLFLLAPLSLGAPLITTALVVSALASAITLWLLYDLGRLLESRVAGLLSVLAYLPLQTTDLRTRELIFLIPMFLLSLNLGIRLMRNGRDTLYIWLTLSVGLMINTHYQGLLLLIGIIAALSVTSSSLPATRGIVLLLVAAMAVIFAATPVMALSRLPLWAMYTLIVCILLWSALPYTNRLGPILLVISLAVAIFVAPAAVQEGFRRLVNPQIPYDHLQKICLTIGAGGGLLLLASWVRKGFARRVSAEALLIPLILVIIVLGSVILKLIFNISWRYYFWEPTYALLSLTGGIAVARILVWVQIGVWSRRAVSVLLVCLILVASGEGVQRRINRPNLQDEMTLGEAKALLTALIAVDGIPQVHDHISKFNRIPYNLSLLYRLGPGNTYQQDRELIAYLERPGTETARLVYEKPWLSNQQIGRYQIFWFAVDPNIGDSKLVSLDEGYSFQMVVR